MVLKNNDSKESNLEPIKRKSDNSLEKQTAKKQKALDEPVKDNNVEIEKTVIEDESEPQVEEVVITKEIAVEKVTVNGTQFDEKEEETTKDNVEIKDLNSPAHTTIEEEEEEERPTDSPSPPSFLTEPSTPPIQLEEPTAPFKTYLTEADKMRIEQEKSTLVKLRKALDIVITDRMARNRPTLYHQIESVLRNSTRKSITISHVSKIMYIAPSLYQLDAKELRDFGGKVTEAFLIQFSKDWQCPLAGKDLQKRADMITDALEDYFSIHTEVIK